MVYLLYEVVSKGCLFEFIFEILVEVIIELIGLCYISLMQLIVPHKTINENIKRVIKIVATTIAAILGVVLIIGLIFLIQEDAFFNRIGKYMTYIALMLIALQIALGLLAKVIRHFRK